MKFRCLDNTDVEGLLTVGKEYKGEVFGDMCVHVFRCDDKGSAHFLPARFELVPEEIDTVSEPEVSIYVYTLEGKQK